MMYFGNWNWPRRTKHSGRQIGEQFDYKDVKLEVEIAEEPYCTGCYFNGETIDCCHRSIRKIIGSCNAFNRSDLKYIIFKKLE